MALDVLGSLGFFNCRSGSVLASCSGAPRVSSRDECYKQQSNSWFRWTGTCSSGKFTNILYFEKGTFPEALKHGRLRSWTRQETFRGCGSSISLPSAARFWRSKTAGTSLSRTDCLSSVLKGWTRGEVPGEGRNSLLPNQRHTSCPLPSMQRQQQRRRKDAGRVVCSSVVRILSLKRISGLTNRGGPVHGASHIRPLQRPDSAHSQPLTSAREVFVHLRVIGRYFSYRRTIVTVEVVSCESIRVECALQDVKAWRRVVFDVLSLEMYSAWSYAENMAWGQMTAGLYGLIRDAKYNNAIKMLEEQLVYFPDSHAGLSLSAYCHYMVGNFHAAASLYEQLAKGYPTEEKYAIYHAQSLYKGGMYVNAARACMSVEGYQTRVINLQACIRNEQGDISGSRMLLEQIVGDDIDAKVNLGCCLYKEGDYTEALSKFNDALNVLGFEPELVYNKALCLYQLKLYDSASNILAEIFEHGVREHPELSVGSHIEGMDLRSVGNSPTLKESALVEAFNLKAAIEYVHGNFDATREALDDMPPRSEDELDCVTLHNQALMNMDKDPTVGFRKLNFLLQSPPFPPETFGNLLLLYCKPSHGFYDLAADVMAENADFILKYLSQDLYDFLDATILAQTSTEEAYQKFNEFANRHGETLRCLTKQIQNARTSRDQEAYKKALTKYEETLETYIPVIMAMAKIWWDKENYLQVERILHQSADLCSEHGLWKLNVAHTFFMQDNRFKEAIHYYEPIVQKAEHKLFNVTAIVLANLCVCYIMTSRNEEAEELMRKIEKEEERAHYEDPEKQNLHLCIVNLVIGTLYCAKQNFEFGIGRIIKSLEPYGKKIEHDTWFYARRCFLALIDNLAKQMIVLKDATYADIDEFMEAAELHGKDIVTMDESSNTNSAAVCSLAAPNIVTKRSVSQEAQMLKYMFLKARE